MFAHGLAAEVTALRARGLHRDTPGLRSIGYAEFFAATAPEEVLRLIQRNTRRLAKRQLTFFRRFPEVRWLAADAAAEVGAAIERFLGPVDAPAAGAARAASAEAPLTRGRQVGDSYGALRTARHPVTAQRRFAWGLHPQLPDPQSDPAAESNRSRSLEYLCMPLWAKA